MEVRDKGPKGPEKGSPKKAGLHGSGYVIFLQTAFIIKNVLTLDGENAQLQAGGKDRGGCKV